MIARNAFNYTVDRILRRRCVPVAGAGISMSSSSPSTEKVHNVKWMVNTLKKELFKLRSARYKAEEHGTICKCWCSHELEALGHKITGETCKGVCFFCDITKAASANQLGCLSELYLWEFASLDVGYKSLVEVLKIDQYRDLCPTPAHYYIAKLSREGLINEVITTNYDCNFEKAYVELSGASNSDVISCLDDYRKKGAEIGDVNVNRLKVFKVNGCAERLVDTDFKNRYESILLTERQLQKWRNRQWAADVFRDRLRSKSLIFVGFGSDEPQVHHTLQTVLDEYTDELEDNDKDVLETHSAPIVAVFDAYPTFHQQQIVNTYALHHKKHPQGGDKLIIRHPDREQNLTADELWKSIYERVARTLIVEALKTSIQSMNASFTSVLPFSEVILHQVISTLEGTFLDDSDYCTATPTWLDSISGVISAGSADQEAYSALAASLSKLNGRQAKEYDPINENKALMSELVTLLFLFEGLLSPISEQDLEGGIALSFKHSEARFTGDKLLYLNADPSFVSSGDEVNVPIGNNHLALALGQAGAHIRPSLRRVINKDTAAGSITPKIIVTLGWQHIFHQKPYDGNKDTVAETLLDAVDSPTNYFYANQPSIKRRTYLREA
ncbi:SIR2 family protein [Vibrio cholerae]|nr:SIR2 family protein [Vibrio cholerae]EKF9374652.1 SIR2 family protein [Vibrio cholerae]ELF1687511.1 SIR2 family protein [Vibrio cholerae]MBY8199432.1 SIR2 family protein [Vibrio fluvialis]GIC33199.1 SIR2-like domain protein [Vibrio cholerae]